MVAPKISVLLPTHDRPEMLKLSIASILAQSEADFELLVVGDGASRKVARVVKQIKDKRLRWFDLPKAPGFGYANRNIALKEARGALIACASDDDIMMPEHLARLARLFEAKSVQWAYCRPLWVNGSGDVLPAFLNLTAWQARDRFLHSDNLIAAGCVMHRRSCFDDVGYWPEELERGGDWELWKRILRHYGPGAIGFARQPTHLHFRADWREELGDFWPFRLAQLAAVARVSQSWPAALRLAPEEGESFQAFVARRLEEDPALPDRIAYGVNVLQDHIAWTASTNAAFD